MASTPAPVTSAIPTGAWGRPLRPAPEGAESETIGSAAPTGTRLAAAPPGWDIAPVLPPPPAPAATVARSRWRRRAVAELVLAVVVLAVLGFVFRPSAGQLPLADTAARMAADLSSLETSVAAGDPSGAIVRVRADLAEARRVPAPTDPVAESAWRYAVSEATAALAEVGHDTPLAETDLSAALQAVLLVQPGQRR